jgi:23S rRNA (cytosine1962-C5)-methyltransferase
MSMKSKYGGAIHCGEIGLPITCSGLNLPCGILGRWESE